jgi:hypothetical protein
MTTADNILYYLNRLKINTFTSPKGSNLILAAQSPADGVQFFAPIGVGVIEEPERSGIRRSQYQSIHI